MDLDYYDGYAGRHIVTMPIDAAEECSRPGQRADDAVEHWRDRVTWHASEDDLRRMLRECGTWEDLDSAESDTLRDRALWVAACDLRENGEIDAARYAEAMADTDPAE